MNAARRKIVVSFGPVVRRAVVALEACVVTGCLAAIISATKFPNPNRWEELVYDSLKWLMMLALLSAITVDLCALFSPRLQRFALYSLGRLWLYVLVVIVVFLIPFY